MISITSDVSLWYKSCCKNKLNYDNDNKWKKLTAIKNRFSLIVEQMLAFFLSTCLEKLRIFQMNCQVMFYIKDNSHSDMTYHKLHWEIVSIRTYCWLRNKCIFCTYKQHGDRIPDIQDAYFPPYLLLIFWYFYRFEWYFLQWGIQAFVLVKSNNWFSVYWKSFLYSFIYL